MANKKITALDLAPFVGLQCAIYKNSKPSHLFSKQMDGVDIKLNKVIVGGKKYNPIKYLVGRGFNMELIPHGTYLIGSNNNAVLSKYSNRKK